MRRRPKILRCVRALCACLAMCVICRIFPTSEQGVGAWTWVELTVREVLVTAGLADSMCDSSGARHLPEFGGGCFLRDRLTCPGLPTLHSAFAEPARGELVFVGVKSRDEAWDRSGFLCEFPNGEATLADPVVRDHRSFGSGYPQYLVVITCPMPPALTGEVQRRAARRFRVNFRLAADPRYAYTGVPVCLTESRHHRQLTLCTMVKDMGRYIPDWLFYYKSLGVEHVYIYDNDPRTTLPRDLRGYLDTGFATLVPWAHTPSQGKTYLEVQIAHENDCLWRQRHSADWVLKVDVDEFVQPLDPNRTRLTDYLAGPGLKSLATVKIMNWFFGRPPQSRKVASARTVFERNPWRVPSATPENRGRDKCIVRPLNVHYFKIHGVKVGGDTLTLDPEADLRLVHYRRDNPRHRGFRMHRFVKDTSMIELWNKLTSGQEVSPELFKQHTNASP